MRRRVHVFVRLAAPGLVSTALLLAVGPAGSAQAAGPVGGDLLGSSGVVVTPGATPLPKMNAGSWLVADLTTGTVLAAKNAHGRFMPASTLKTLTALTALPLLDKTSTYIARAQDTRAEGTRVGLIAGLPYTVDQLFYGLFLASGNDAASAVANDEGGRAATVRAMNALAVHLQADDTHAVNPSGLDAKGQMTSAYDLALFAQAGLMRPDFARYVSARTYAFPGKMPKVAGKPRPTFQIQNQNRLLMHGYPGMAGVKTGYTTLAGRTYVGAARRNGHLLLVTLMKIDGASEDAARKLLNWGFRNVGKPGVGELVQPLSATSASPSPTPGLRAVAAAGVVGVAHGSALPAPLWLAAGLAGAVSVGTGLVAGRRRKLGRRDAARMSLAARRNTRL